MAQIMVDLETLGSVPGCALLSIGAVVFMPATFEITAEFYCIVDRQSCADAGLHEDPATLAWWGKQSLDARQVIEDASSDAAIDISIALDKFNAFIAASGKSPHLWGNGADFDNAILAAAYRATGRRPGWPFWQNRCYRTLKSLRPDMKLQRSGTHHNALDDARTQAHHLMQILAMLP